MKLSTKLILAVTVTTSTIALGDIAQIARAAQTHGQRSTISLSNARRIAIEARPGTITSGELEKESGGSGLRYSFDIKSGTRTYEVGVDAKTGKVLENAPEGKNPD